MAFVRKQLPFMTKTTTSSQLYRTEDLQLDLPQQLIAKEYLDVQPDNSMLLAEESEQPKANKDNVKLLLLDDGNFKSALLKYHMLLVMFYAPWCKYCNDMKPLFRRVARDLPKGIGHMGYCNAEESKRTALEYGVYDYPSLKLFRGGEFLKDYEGPRRSLELINFMVENAKEDMELNIK